MGPGDVVKFTAPKGDVVVRFTKKKPPFVSKANPFTVKKGVPRYKTVAADANGEFAYHLTCRGGCGNLSQDPSMIVP